MASPTEITTLSNVTNTVDHPEHGEMHALLVTSPHHVPVAPAVVVVEDRNDSIVGEQSTTHEAMLRTNNTAYYPVATFVRDLVRTSMDHVNNARIAQNAHAADVATNTAAARRLRDVHAVRSEGDVFHRTTPRLREIFSAHDLGEDEFIIVDGELIAIPPPPPNQQEQEGLSLALMGQNRACQPSGNRFRRGVRRLNKLFKRKLPPKLERISSAESQRQTTCSDIVDSTPFVDGGVQETRPVITTNDSLTKRGKNRLGRRERKKSWKQMDSLGSTSERESQTASVSPAAGLLADHQTSLSAPPFSNCNWSTLAPIPSPSLVAQGPRTQSVTASFVGTADQLLEAGVLPAAAMSAEAYVEFDDPFHKKDDGPLMSLIPKDADYKVDKADTIDVEFMLRRAAFESLTDLETTEAAAVSPPRRQAIGKTDGGIVPLSLSCAQDEATSIVHNEYVFFPCLLTTSGILWPRDVSRISTVIF
jgi:hypothetical protein